MKIIAALAIAMCFLTVCYGNEATIVYSKVRNAAELEGSILDQAGAAIPQVRVSEMSDDGTAVRSTTTDSHGHWSLAFETGKTYRIQFSKHGFHIVQIRVKVTNHHAKPLTVEMPVS